MKLVHKGSSPVMAQRQAMMMPVELSTLVACAADYVI